MRFTIREQPILKSAVYSIICLGLLLFSHSFFPALQIANNVPCLLVAAISLLAMTEGAKYACLFAAVFGIVETLMLGTNMLVIPLFYTAFALICVWLFESFFVKNFLAWLCYSLGGLVIYFFISLFAPVTNWGITAADILMSTTIPAFLMSVVFSLPLYPIFKFVKNKTDKER